MENQKLTTEELEQINKLRENFNHFSSQLGQLEFQLMNIEIEKESIKENIKILVLEEKNLIQSIEENYGKGNIVLESGEFIPAL